MEDQSRSFVDDGHDDDLLANEPPLEGTRDRMLSTPPPDLSSTNGLATEAEQTAFKDQLETTPQPKSVQVLEASDEPAAAALSADERVQAPPSPAAPAALSGSHGLHSPPLPAMESENGHAELVNSASLISKAEAKVDSPADEPPKEGGLGDRVKKTLAPASNMVANTRKAFEGKAGTTSKAIARPSVASSRATASSATRSAAPVSAKPTVVTRSTAGTSTVTRKPAVPSARPVASGVTIGVASRPTSSTTTTRPTVSRVGGSAAAPTMTSKRSSMLPPSSTRPIAAGSTGLTHTASTGPTGVRRTGPSPAPSSAINGKEPSNSSVSAVATRRASAASRLGAPISTGFKRTVPAINGSAAATKPGQTRQSMSAGATPRATLGSVRSQDRAPLSKALGPPGVKPAAAGIKPGRQELEDKIAGLETALASAQKTINERLGPAPVTDEDQGASEIDALRKDLASTRAELDELKAMTPKSDDLESIRGQLTAKETELVALRNQLEHDVEKSLNEVDTVRELLDNERKMKIEDENMLQTTLSSLRTRHDALELELDNRKKEKSVDDSQIEILKEQIAILERQIAEASIQARSLAELHETSQEELAAAKEALRTAIEESNLTRAELEKVTAEITASAVRAEAESLQLSQQRAVDELEARIQQLEADAISSQGQCEGTNPNRDDTLEELKGAHQIALSEALSAATAEHDRLRIESKSHLDEALERLTAAHEQEVQALRDSQAASLDTAIAAAQVSATTSSEAKWAEKEQSIKQELDDLLPKSSTESQEKDALLQTIKTDLEALSAKHFAEIEDIRSSQALELTKTLEIARTEASAEHSKELSSLRKEYEVTIEQLRTAHTSEVDALQSNLQPMEMSMKAEHSKEISSLGLDLQTHREDLARAKQDATAQDAELQALREQINTVTADLNVARSTAAPMADDSAMDQLHRTIANLREELGSHQESADLTKASLVRQIEILSENRDKELEAASVARVEEVEAIKRTAEDMKAANRAEVEALRQRLDEERAVKNDVRVAEPNRTPPSSPCGVTGEPGEPSESMTMMHEAHARKVAELEVEITRLKAKNDEEVTLRSKYEEEASTKTQKISYLEDQAEADGERIAALEETEKRLTDDIERVTSADTF